MYYLSGSIISDATNHRHYLLVNPKVAGTTTMAFDTEDISPLEQEILNLPTLPKNIEDTWKKLSLIQNF